MKITILKLITIMSIICLFAGPLIAKTSHDNAQALQELKQAHVYFDVNLKEDELLTFRLEMLGRTITMMADAGLEVTAVIGFRGGASRFITRDDHYVLEEDMANKKKIQDMVRRFAAEGITLEQCAIAADILDIPYEDFMPEITIVGNGYVSLIGYQAQGYAVVPMD